ncbi:hypothetical protein [Mesorhizobium sp. 1B3]|uniref:hypothetical protein n=1 Tax=Mesorhizobium sp. 1B3 TaxID=3243599 RepID=UPI003D95D47F
MDNDQTNQEIMGKSNQDFQNLADLGLTGLLVGAAISTGAGLLGEGTKSAAGAAWEYIKREGPVALRVLATWQDGNCPCVAFEFLNLTGHGAYIEDMWLLEPARNFSFYVWHRPRAEIGGFGQKIESPWVKSADRFPIYVPPLAKAEIGIRLTDDAAKLLSSNLVANIQYKYSVVGGEHAAVAPEKCVKKVSFRIRAAGPAYIPKPQQNQ